MLDLKILVPLFCKVKLSYNIAKKKASDLKKRISFSFKDQERSIMSRIFLHTKQLIAQKIVGGKKSLILEVEQLCKLSTSTYTLE